MRRVLRQRVIMGIGLGLSLGFSVYMYMAVGCRLKLIRIKLIRIKLIRIKLIRIKLKLGSDEKIHDFLGPNSLISGVTNHEFSLTSR